MLQLPQHEIPSNSSVVSTTAIMAAGLEEHLQTVLENALTGLEMDQSGNTFAAQLAYRSAMSCLSYCADNLLSEQDPMVWLEACRQVQAVLADRIQARKGSCV